MVIGRSDGHSAVAAAAYRAGAKLRDEGTGQEHDYSGRRGVAHSEILLPAGCDERFAERAYLWNEVEASEKRKDAQLCRSVTLALPHELTAEQRLSLTRHFVQEQFVSKGMIADFAIHEPVAEKGENPKNFHAHVLLTLRKGTAAGLHPVKTREWNAKANMEHWRAAWSAAQNRILERHGHKDRVDHRRLDEQRADAWQRGEVAKAVALTRYPERDIGHRAWAMLKQGHEPDPAKRQARPPRPDRPITTRENPYRQKLKRQMTGRELELWLMSKPKDILALRSEAAFKRLSDVLDANRQGYRQLKELWQRRQALAMQRQQFYSQVAAGMRPGVNMSPVHLQLRLTQLAQIQAQGARLMQAIAAAQMRQEARKRELSKTMLHVKSEQMYVKGQRAQAAQQREFDRQQKEREWDRREAERQHRAKHQTDP